MARNVDNIVKELHKLNFGLEDYCVDSCDRKGKNFFDKVYHNYSIEISFCNKCNINSKEFCINKDISNYDKYAFTNVSHGSHSQDYFDANAKPNDIEEWTDYPIMFVMENPSTCYVDKDVNDEKLCRQYVETDGRYLPNWWYWGVGVYRDKNGEETAPNYPEYFWQKSYGGLFYSIINTFKLKNAYITNFVKCGVGYCDNGKEYGLSTEFYNSTIKENCVEHRLTEEIKILGNNGADKVIIFAFGQNAYYGIQNLLKCDNYEIYLLPHPANRLANDYRKYVLLGKLAKGLLKERVYENKLPDITKKIIGYLVDDKENEHLAYTLTEVEKEIIIQKFKEKGFEQSSGSYVFKNPRFCFDSDGIVFRYKPKNEILEDGSEVIWVKYYFEDKYLEVYTGKNNNANKKYTGNIENFSFVKEVQNILIDIRIISTNEVK